jgi:hypothetical protein
MALAAVPVAANAAPKSHAKAWGWRCNALSKVKDPTTKMSPRKQCKKSKGAGFVLGPDGRFMVPVVTPTV